VRTPDWSQLETFFRADGWTEVRRSNHVHWEKVLPHQTLRSHRSFASDKTMSPGRFRSILSLQLKVSEEQFWETVRTGKPATRPGQDLQPAPKSLPLWLHAALREEVGLTDAQFVDLDESRALQMLGKHRSRRG
jgi:hypothetical protein